ncbi:ExeA family protein [Pseudofulvimonas gallinarii]|uniref:Type II secretion system protein A n=1 Tax=Pseudofulvimonas gallinarii TaxID=634155 RepID=A0A4R3L6E7_9GAMM|nr:AAA family ATPase [Pseudofulvimonas gallinarii]TCS93774.1 type II secretion system protein A [Pseudofulvimonas gallinarii]THD13257.1 hypothetical protein B1808_08950 [Pseudofulvimonas gallinarii]
MYFEHYGLAEAPFSITPDPRFVFLSDRHRDALAHLVYGIAQGGSGGFVQLTGEVGTGKTTLSRLLLEQLPENTRVALVLNPRLNPVELLEAICEELHIDVGEARGSSKALVDALNRYLLDAHARDLRVVLILDEAQQLSVESLEQVRLLTNLETATQKLLQIVLLGQPELRELLARPDLRQLAQRITARYHLTPLDSEETATYLRHRLAVAGLRRSPFTPAAEEAIHRHSGGVPRLINVIAERALVAGYAEDRTQLDARVVDRAAAELLDRPVADMIGRRAWPLAAIALLALAAIVFLAWNGWTKRHPEPLVDDIVDAETLAPEPALQGAPPDVAAQALLRVHGIESSPALVERVIECPFRLQQNLYCARSRGNLTQLALLDRPVLLILPQDQGDLGLVLTGLDADQATVAGAQSQVVSRGQLESLWPGEYVSLLSLPAAVSAIHSGPLPAWARPALDRYESNRSLSPLSDQDERIRRLQRQFGVRADAVVGPETWWLLSALLEGGPRLGPPDRPQSGQPIE